MRIEFRRDAMGQIWFRLNGGIWISAGADAAEAAQTVNDLGLFDRKVKAPQSEGRVA